MSVDSQATNSSPIENLITEHIDIWSSAIKRKSSAGRGSSKKIELYGIKKLRELILELAVRGKLVPQDPNDEPASVLLERIVQEKAQLVKEGKIKKQKPLPDISEDEKPFELPKGWEWSRFDNLPLGYSVGIDRGKALQGLDNEFRYFKMNNISNEGRANLSNIVYIDATDDEVQQYSLKKNDFLFNTRNSKELVGKTCVYVDDLEDPILYNNNILRAFFSESKLSFILDIWMRSQSGKLELDEIKSGTTNVWAIYQGKLVLLPCIIPPTAEQHRIVAKVDELMALCDQLEAQAEFSLDAHQTLVTVLLDTLVNSQNAEELAENWTRISGHFDTLFTTERSIDQLKQTILQLAVMGKLVKQDSNDEPASALLERIAAEKADLIRQKKIKKQKPLPPITEDEKPFELPQGWEWCRINDLLNLKNGYAFKSKFFDLEIGPYVLATPGNFHETGGFRDRGNKTKYYNGPVQDDFLLEVGDLIIPLTEQAPGLLGSAAFIPDDGKTYLHNQRLAKLSPFSTTISKKFVALFFNSPFLRSELANTCSGTTVRHSSPDRVLQTLIPLVSLEEQHRIVAKVDELMAICDQLKARLSDVQTTQLNLADALVEQAL
jgi:type I restriction enzyme S subunit